MPGMPGNGCRILKLAVLPMTAQAQSIVVDGCLQAAFKFTAMGRVAADTPDLIFIVTA